MRESSTFIVQNTRKRSNAIKCKRVPTMLLISQTESQMGRPVMLSTSRIGPNSRHWQFPEYRSIVGCSGLTSSASGCRSPKDWPVRKAIPPSTHLILPDTNIRGLKAASSLREKQSKWNGEGDRGRQAGTSDGWKGRQTGWRADDANSHKCLSKNGHATAGWEHGKKSRPLPLSREHHDHVAPRPC